MKLHRNPDGRYSLNGELAELHALADQLQAFLFDCDAHESRIAEELKKHPDPARRQTMGHAVDFFVGRDLEDVS